MTNPSGHTFWAEMSASEHILHVYENEALFLDILVDFVSDGLMKGETAIVVATPRHRQRLDALLELRGIDVAAAKSDEKFISLDAEETLEKFMLNPNPGTDDKWPDEAAFYKVITDLLKRTRAKERKVRVFGEMVALLWEKGHCAATVRLEHLWHGLCAKESFNLFCAYPKAGFMEDPVDSIARISALHSKSLAS